MLHREEGNSILHCCSNMATGQIEIIWYPSPEHFISPSCQLREHMCTHADACGSHSKPRWVYPMSARLRDWGGRKEGGDEDEVRQSQLKGGDLENGKVEGGAAVCDENRREGREEERRRVCPSLLSSHINPTAVWCAHSSSSEWICIFFVFLCQGGRWCLATKYEQ